MKILVAILAVAAMNAAAAPAETVRSSDYDYEAPAPGTYVLPFIKTAADGPMLDSAAKPIRLSELMRGHITVVSFIYTRCAAAKACPYATGVLMQLHDASAADAALAKELRLVSISFDPVDDTPERMARYSGIAAERPTAAPWHFLTARTEKDLQPILDGYGQAVNKKKNVADPTGPLNHTLRVFLVDAKGSIRNIYSSGTLDPRLVLSDVKTLMLESAQSNKKPLPPQEAANKSSGLSAVTKARPIKIRSQP